ncbi:MAG: hypothetical protein ACKVIQ_17555, partial [Acidimicrobiales bacterium]
GAEQENTDIDEAEAAAAEAVAAEQAAVKAAQEETTARLVTLDGADLSVGSPFVDNDFSVVGDQIEGILRQAHESSLSIRQDAAKRTEDM